MPMATARTIALRVVVLLVFEARARVARAPTQQPSPSAMALKMACRTRCSMRLKTPRTLRAVMAVHPSSCEEGPTPAPQITHWCVAGRCGGVQCVWTPAPRFPRPGCGPRLGRWTRLLGIGWWLRSRPHAAVSQLSLRDQVVEQERGPGGCVRVVSEAAAYWAPPKLAVPATSRRGS